MIHHILNNLNSLEKCVSKNYYLTSELKRQQFKIIKKYIKKIRKELER